MNSSDPTAQVLIVDPSEDTRDVLQTILEAKGIPTIGAGLPETGLDLMRKLRPAVTVLDGEIEVTPPHDDEDSPTKAFLKASTGPGSSLIILGSADAMDATGDKHLVRKPYHYGPLVRKIEELVEQVQAD